MCIQYTDRFQLLYIDYGWLFNAMDIKLNIPNVANISQFKDSRKLNSDVNEKPSTLYSFYLNFNTDIWK